MGERQLLVAKYKYDAQESKELSIEKNEVLTLIDDSGRWWKVRNDSDDEGFVPSNFVRQVNWKDAIGRRFGILKESLRRKNGCELSSSPVKLPHCSHPVGESAKLQLAVQQNDDTTATTPMTKAEACFDYNPCREDELKLRKGDRIDVLEKSTDGWWRGICVNQCGWFPSNYVIERSSPIVSDAENDDNPIPVSSPYLHRPSSGGKSNQFSRDGEQHIWQRERPCPEDAQSSLVNNLHATRLSGVANGSAKHLYSSKKWYFGKLSRERCQKLLDDYGADGDYLIRDSESNPGDLSISLKAPSKNKHFWIQVDSDGFRIGSRRFCSIDELIGHYTSKPISSNGRGQNLYLVKPFGQ